MKKRKIILIVVVALIILSPLIYVFTPSLNNTDDIADFSESKYVSFYGGKQAERFFNTYVDMQNSDIVGFQYRNYRFKFALYRANTTFCVDVKYSEDLYAKKFDEIFPDTDRPNLEEGPSYYGDYLITTIMLNEPLYKDNYCGVFFNDKTNTIRYVFIYGGNRENVLQSDPRRVMSRSSEKLDWGYGKRYSKAENQSPELAN